jgi:hypothetical protein
MWEMDAEEARLFCRETGAEKQLKNLDDDSLP